MKKVFIIFLFVFSFLFLSSKVAIACSITFSGGSCTGTGSCGSGYSCVNHYYYCSCDSCAYCSSSCTCGCSSTSCNGGTCKPGPSHPSGCACGYTSSCSGGSCNPGPSHPSNCPCGYTSSCSGGSCNTCCIADGSCKGSGSSCCSGNSHYDGSCDTYVRCGGNSTPTPTPTPTHTPTPTPAPTPYCYCSGDKSCAQYPLTANLCSTTLGACGGYYDATHRCLPTQRVSTSYCHNIDCGSRCIEDSICSGTCGGTNCRRDPGSFACGDAGCQTCERQVGINICKVSGVDSICSYVCQQDNTCGACGVPTSAPTPTPTPTPNTPPIGNHDSSSCTSSTGWTCDANDYNQALTVHFYADGPYGGGGTLVGTATANGFRQDLIDAGVCGGTGSHGFNFTTPNSLKDGQPHLIYAYAINIPAGDNPLLSSTPKTVNCALAWWQVKDSDVQSTGSIESNVPASNYFGIVGTGGFPGIASYNGATNLTSTNVSPTGWLVESPVTNTKVYNYDYFANLIPDNITAIMNPVNTLDVAGSLTSSGTADPNGYYWYKYDGALNGGQALTIPAIDFLTRKVILMVDNANINITGNISLTAGQGFFMVIVKGNIIVDSSVGGGGNHNLAGLYFADGTFSDGVGSTQLWIRGSIVANSGISLQRDLGSTGNATTPSELFVYAPDKIMLFPKILGTRKINWKEVAP